MFVKEAAEGPLLHWEICRPERLNALGPTLGRELARKLKELATRLKEKEPTPRLLYLTAAPNPSDVWIAGGDLKELATLVRPEDAQAYALLLTQVCEALASLSIPVAAGLDGKVIGGGLEFALAADLRLATTRTTLDFRQLAIGLATAFGGASRLVKLIGLARATEWQLLCATVDASKAYEAGLFAETHDSREELFLRARTWAKHFEALPFDAVATQKRMLLNQGRTPEQNAREFSHLWRNPLHQKTLGRFSPLQKGEEE